MSAYPVLGSELGTGQSFLPVKGSPRPVSSSASDWQGNHPSTGRGRSGPAREEVGLRGKEAVGSHQRGPAGASMGPRMGRDSENPGSG